MSLRELQARFQRQYQENAAWRLLRAKNTPLILAFISDLFSDSNDVVFSRAKAALDIELAHWRQEDWFDSEKNAATYIREWIQSGWLRELDDQLSKTDAGETALRFCIGLEQRDNKATASHLRIVQDAVCDLAATLSPNSEERIALLESRKDVLQIEINELNNGIVRELSAAEQRERIREIYQLASVLTGDFRRVEDDIRRIDQSLRVQMIEAGSNRGQVLSGLLEEEELLAKSDAGRAFEGFFHLLCDQNRNTEFREQLRSILIRPASQYLNKDESLYLGRLVRELTSESDRVFKVRRRTQESLRAFVESGALLESRRVEQLLGQLQRLAVKFKETEIDLRQLSDLNLASGKITIRSPESHRPRSPEEDLDTRNVAVQENIRIPSDTMLQHLHAVKALEVAADIQAQLQTHGPMSIADLLQQQPIRAGLEELVVYLRVAQAIGATQLDSKETVVVTDRKGENINATIPGFLLSSELFPERLEELSL
ncbi:MAG: DUF3375 domain-containing protein [Thiohalomonadales bacterium]